MTTASLELSKELYELSWWGDTHFQWIQEAGGPWEIVKKPAVSTKLDDWAPAYDLGYLLRKLPASIQSKEYPGEFAKLWTRKDDHPEDDVASPLTYLAWYFVNGKQDVVADYGTSADTPEDAAAKLSIELHKQGVLTHV